MSRSRITQARAKYLMENPEIVARMYELNANGQSTLDLHEVINDEFGSKDPINFVPMHSSIVKRVFHRRPPCTHPEMFKLVKPEHEEAVANRFHKTLRKKKLQQHEIEFEQKPDLSREEKQRILHDLLDARIAYEESLRAAQDAGIPVDAIEAVKLIGEASLAVEVS